VFDLIKNFKYHRATRKSRWWYRNPFSNCSLSKLSGLARRKFSDSYRRNYENRPKKQVQLIEKTPGGVVMNYRTYVLKGPLRLKICLNFNRFLWTLYGNVILTLLAKRLPQDGERGCTYAFVLSIHPDCRSFIRCQKLEAKAKVYWRQLFLVRMDDDFHESPQGKKKKVYSKSFQ